MRERQGARTASLSLFLGRGWEGGLLSWGLWCREGSLVGLLKNVGMLLHAPPTRYLFKHYNRGSHFPTSYLIMKKNVAKVIYIFFLDG